MNQVAAHSIFADLTTIFAELVILLCLPLWAVIVLVAQLVFAVGVPVLMLATLIGPVRHQVWYDNPPRPRA